MNLSNQVVSSTWQYDQSQFSRVKPNKETATSQTINYVKDSCLGSGLYGSVYVLKPDEKTAKTKAIKFSDQKSHSVKYEYDICLKWPKGTRGLLLRPKAYFETFFTDCYIMHQYDGTLADLLYQLTAKEKIEAIDQLCQGVMSLHELGIAHRDIHLSNVFYDKNRNRFDLGDFGCAKVSKLNSKDLSFGIQKDIVHLREHIESILLGKQLDAMTLLLAADCDRYNQRIHRVEELTNLGFSLELSQLLLVFINKLMRGQAKDSQAILQSFKPIKDLL